MDNELAPIWNDPTAAPERKAPAPGRPGVAPPAAGDDEALGAELALAMKALGGTEAIAAAFAEAAGHADDPELVGEAGDATELAVASEISWAPLRRWL
jgi:hypothetical protein